MANTKKMTTKKTTKKVEEKKQPKTWRVFNSVGYNLSIAAICLFWLPLLDLGLAIPALVFAILGKKDLEHQDKQKKAFGMSLAAIILNVVVFLTLVIVLPVLAAHGKI